MASLSLVALRRTGCSLSTTCSLDDFNVIMEIDSEAIGPVSVEPIGPVQGGTEEAQGH